MQALSYIGDVVFVGKTSIQYSHSYNGTTDNMEPNRITQWDNIKIKTNKLLKTPGINYPPKFSSALNTILDICQEWYGFKPKIDEHEIQFFQQLGLEAIDVQRDGHCFFHALSNSIEGYTYLELIELAVRLTGNEDIRNPLAWVGLDFHAIANALAQELGINILLIQQNTVIDQVPAMLDLNFAFGDHDTESTVFIGNIGNMHFVQLTEIVGDLLNQLNALVEAHINTLIPPEEDIPLAIEGIKLSDKDEDSDEESDDSAGDNSKPDSSNSAIHCLYNITYNNTDMTSLCSLTKQNEVDNYQLSIDEQYLLDSFLNRLFK